MRRVLFVGLALVILLIGAGIFVLTANAFTTTPQAHTSTSAIQSNIATAGKATMEESVQAVPVSSTTYDSDAESEFTTPATKSQGRSCDSGY